MQRALILVVLALGLPGAALADSSFSRRLTHWRLQLRAAKTDLLGRAIGILPLLGAPYPLSPKRYPIRWYQEKVSNTLTRGSRVDAAGIQKLKHDGYRSIVALTIESNTDAPYANAAGLNYKRIPLFDNSHPSNAQVKEFLDFVANPANQPVYVHCLAGIGRTGTMVAAYEMAVQGKSAGRVLAESRKYGRFKPNQRRFIRQLWRDLRAGKIAGYRAGAT
jgi:protein tyrosine phosphatase